jgi:exopolyphosphatase / guanosine-5'-triphosphate,3'-diphosphate pyrophosphatase
LVVRPHGDHRAVRVGIVDVGSNTARLLVADVVSGRDVRTVEARKAYLGLGAEIADTGTLSEATIATAGAACRKYAKRARALGSSRMEVVVTAPGRQGAASEALVVALRERTGLAVRILSADDEGRLAFDGAVVRAACAGELPEVVGVVDVGGGSTEVVVGTPHVGPAWVRSVDLGSLRLTRFSFPDDPPRRRAVAKVRASVRDALADVRPVRPDVAFAVGGSARALAKIVGRTFAPGDVETAIDDLSRRRSAKVARAYGLEPTRARTILAGAILLAEAARTLDRPLTLASGGLREGAALALASEGAVAAA